jgi:hypothetical protein
MTKFLIIKILLSCRSFTDARALYAYGRSFTAWRTTTYFRGMHAPGGYGEIPIFVAWMAA